MIKDLNRLIELSIYYRGSIISDCIIIEQEIESYIIGYFVSDFNKFFDMHDVILNKMTFDSKISTFQELLKRRYPEDFEGKYEKLLSELRYLKDIRNKLAHYPINLAYSENEKIPKEFSLINYRNGTEIKVFSKGEFQNFNKRMKKCMEIMVLLSP